MTPLAHLSLRLRIFLFFALLGLGGVTLLAVGLFVGYRQLGDPDALGAFVFGGVLAGFALLGLVTWIWVLFDEHVARPLERLAAELRARAHSGVDAQLDDDLAAYLGDLAPAAAEMSARLHSSRNEVDETVGRETAHLSRVTAQLAAVLAEMPHGVILCAPNHRIILYNTRAHCILGEPEGFGLDQPLDKVLQPGPLMQAYDWLSDPETPDIADIGGVQDMQGQQLTLRMRLIRIGTVAGPPGYVLILEDAGQSSSQPASVAFDFELLQDPVSVDLANTKLRRLGFVVFDTETTGLDPARDEICQIAGIRVLNGNVVGSECFDILVNPGRSIPGASTKIHHIDDAMVANAPPVGDAVKKFHIFAGDAVLVAHNAPFDMAFLRRREAEIGAVFDQPILDTVLLSAMVYGQSAEHTLDALCERLGVTIPAEERHTALGDARATATVLTRLIPMLEAQGIETLGQALAAFKQHTRVIENANH